MTFEVFQKACVDRTEAVFFPLDSWTPTDWACALAGEVGEACNMIKKLRRGEDVDSVYLGYELADIAAYTSLLSARLRISLGAFARSKFNKVSAKRGSSITL